MDVTAMSFNGLLVVHVEYMIC